MELEKAVVEVIEEKAQDGTFKKIIEEKVGECLSKALDDALLGYSRGLYNKISEKIRETCDTVIEHYDFKNYLPKITEVLDNTVKNSVLPDYRKLAENLNIVLEKTPEKITLSELFDKYLECMNNSGIEVSDGKYFDCDSEAYVTATCMKDEDTGEYVFRISEEYETDDFDDYIVKVSIGTSYDGQFVISNVWQANCYYGNFTMGSLRCLNSFVLYLLNLKQNWTKIEIDETEMDGEVCINRCY